jgi:hypothetical protein
VPAPGGRYHQTRNLKGRPIHRIHRTEHGDLRTQTHRSLLIHPAFLIGRFVGGVERQSRSVTIASHGRRAISAVLAQARTAEPGNREPPDPGVLSAASRLAAGHGCSVIMPN